jgi:hypothetical protein
VARLGFDSGGLWKSFGYLNGEKQIPFGNDRQNSKGKCRCYCGAEDVGGDFGGLRNF